MIYIDDATNGQLITICLHEDCPLDYKYEAARELELRKWQPDMLIDLIRLYGKGLTYFQIGIELGVSKEVVKWQVQKHGLEGTRKSGRQWNRRTA